MNDKKETVFMFIFVASFLISVWFLCTSRNDVYDNRNGADKVRDELTNATNSQREEASVIDETKQSINRSEAAVTNSQERIESSEQTNREIADAERADAEIIAESQSILSRARERTATENSQS